MNNAPLKVRGGPWDRKTKRCRAVFVTNCISITMPVPY